MTLDKPSPDFALLSRFVRDLRDEADWVETIHRDDNKKDGSGQAATDAKLLRRLADRVEQLDVDARRVGRNIGYLERWGTP